MPESRVPEIGVLTRSLLAIARDGTDERALAGRICRAFVDELDVDGAAMSVLTTSEARQTLSATDAVADLLEDLQFGLNEGACMDAATSGAPVLVTDIHDAVHAARWPVFTAAVRERSPVRALFALPLRWGSLGLGVLDLYGLAPGLLPDAQLADALSAADATTLMILGQRTDPDGHGGWLDPVLGHRAEIHQATGMVVAQLDVGVGEAMARLRGYAFAHDRLLIDVARDVVERRITFTRDMT